MLPWLQLITCHRSNERRFTGGVLVTFGQFGRDTPVR